MYLAKVIIEGISHFFLRESYRKDDIWCFRDLFSFGPDPSVFIRYPGGNSFYIDEAVEEGVLREGGIYDENEVEQLLMAFVDPYIRDVVDRFCRPLSRKLSKLGVDDKRRIAEEIHIFDRRRLHYLRYGAIDQGRIYKAPDKIFRILLDKSRDELEQYFLSEERVLQSRELKQYIYVIFNIQRYFTELSARLAPAALPTAKVDDRFVEEICALDGDQGFWIGLDRDDRIHPYLRRYLTGYFDNQWPENRASEEYIRRFVNEHRTYRPPASQRTKMEVASTLFGVSWEDLRSMSQRELTRLYRKKAHELHPDKGGEQEKFVDLTELYKALSERNK
ncbi:MAG: hypothetical protein OEV64_11035 [Desulfobulbaceae bacterium]|nr:hypothetical protein [Desulfobulbaceae bacterium]